MPRSSSHAAFSGVASPHSGMATPTASGPAGLFSPGPSTTFFGGGSLAMRHGSMQALGEALSLGMRSGTQAQCLACFLGFCRVQPLQQLPLTNGTSNGSIASSCRLLHVQRSAQC